MAREYQLFLTSSIRMESLVFPVVFLAVFSQLFKSAQAREFCQAEGYWCDTGHCCGSGECCTYYYELWWFWLVWFLIVFIIGFCVWQRKRFHPWRDNRCERSCSIQDMFRGFSFPDITPVPPCKLPSYAEIGETVSYDTPPPPYAAEAAVPACLGEGPSTSLPAGQSYARPPPHRSLQAINRNCSSLNSTPSPSDDPPSYSEIITSNTRIFGMLPSTQILPQHMLTTGTQYPEQGQAAGSSSSTREQQSNQSSTHTEQNQNSTSTSREQQQNQNTRCTEQQQNQNNSGSNRLNSPATPVAQVAASAVATCSCGSPLRSPSLSPPHARMLPPSVPSSPKPTIVAMKQRPQRFLSPHSSPSHFTTSVVNSATSSRNSSCSNLSIQGSPQVGRSAVSHSGTPPITPPRPGTAVRTSPSSGGSAGNTLRNEHTVVDMRTAGRRAGFMSRFHFR